MNPKEKAIELFEIFDKIFIDDEDEFYMDSAKRIAIKSALKAIDEILKQISKVCVDHLLHDQVIYWEQVKEEIQKL